MVLPVTLSTAAACAAITLWLALRLVPRRLNGIAVGDVGRFEKELLARIHANHASLLEGIRTKKDLTPELEAELKDILAAFVKTFA